MNLESQVCSLELSKRLCELGVKNEPLFFWYKGYKDKPFCDYHEQGCIHQDYPNPEIICSAFTISELLELLPHRITIKENEPFNSFKLNIEKSFIIDDEIIIRLSLINGWEKDLVTSLIGDVCRQRLGSNDEKNS